jgi:hypothetical protein
MLLKDTGSDVFLKAGVFTFAPPIKINNPDEPIDGIQVALPDQVA